MRKNGMFLVCALALAFLSCGADDAWVARINGKQKITLQDYREEFNVFARKSGLSKDDVTRFYGSDDEKLAFLNKMIEKELIYLEALTMKLDTNKTVITAINEQCASQVVQYYALSLVGGSNMIISDAEKRAAFDEMKGRIPNGAAIRYEDVKRQIESLVQQKKMTEMYRTIIESAKKEFNVTVDLSKDTIAEVGGVKILRSMVEDKIQKLEDNGLIPPGNRDRVRLDVANDLVGTELLKLKSKKAGYWETPEGKTVYRLAKKQVLVEEYLLQRMKPLIKETTDAEIDRMGDYAAQYGIANLPYTEQRKRLAMIVKQGKMQRIQEYIVKTLIEENRIEKKAEVIRE
ncbi:MAG: hypothetical protein HZC28_15485 [Spirochaetes bacterium]|nr:hypothetical protein [Spirochaetota bacterium]